MGFLLQLEAITSPPHVKRKPLIAVNILKEWITDQLYTQAVQTLKTNGPENTRGERERESCTHTSAYGCTDISTHSWPHELLTLRRGFSKVATSNYTHTHRVVFLKAYLWSTANNYCCNIITDATSLTASAPLVLPFPLLCLFSRSSLPLYFSGHLSTEAYYGSFKAPLSETNLLQTGSGSHYTHANLAAHMHTCTSKCTKCLQSPWPFLLLPASQVSSHTHSDSYLQIGISRK